MEHQAVIMRMGCLCRYEHEKIFSIDYQVYKANYSNYDHIFVNQKIHYFITVA